eukprot:comp22050_c0_seq1/m.32050 comp22050_c0_seq1/g.32050  ORF comp22050_c0_seq1/g.32050 comp22050_c0_seq1/m.32050 type:complete len:238 (-) comp22050_c0_seq1:216-929(-)
MSKVKKDTKISTSTPAVGKGTTAAAAAKAATTAAEEENSVSLGPMPMQAKVVRSILSSMGVDDYEPRVVNMLLEFAHRYVGDVLEDALVYSDHANKARLDVDDVRLAIQSRVDYSFTGPPPREFMMELAEKRNNVPLPPLKDAFGVHLPPERYWLSTVNYQVAVSKEDENKQEATDQATTRHVPGYLARSAGPHPEHSMALMEEDDVQMRAPAWNPIVVAPIKRRHEADDEEDYDAE